MKKVLLFVAAALVAAVPSHAQLFEAVGNPIVVGGGAYQFEQPATGSRTAFMLSANVAGMKLSNLPVYFGGVGVALPASIDSVAAQFGSFVMLTVPGITWYPGGDNPGTLSKVCVQAGYAYILNGDAKSRSSIYAGVGFAWDSPAYLKYKREVKKAAKAKAAGKTVGPIPSNPYDVR